MTDCRSNRKTLKDGLPAGQGDTTPVDPVMVCEDEAMHDYLCQRIDAGTRLNQHV